MAPAALPWFPRAPSTPRRPMFQIPSVEAATSCFQGRECEIIWAICTWSCNCAVLACRVTLVQIHPALAGANATFGAGSCLTHTYAQRNQPKSDALLPPPSIAQDPWSREQKSLAQFRPESELRRSPVLVQIPNIQSPPSLPTLRLNPFSALTLGHRAPTFQSITRGSCLMRYYSVFDSAPPMPRPMSTANGRVHLCPALPLGRTGLFDPVSCRLSSSLSRPRRSRRFPAPGV